VTSVTSHWVRLKKKPIRKDTHSGLEHYVYWNVMETLQSKARLKIFCAYGEFSRDRLDTAVGCVQKAPSY
jgi:hypothetical protein